MTEHGVRMIRILRHPRDYTGKARTSHVWQHPVLRDLGIEVVDRAPDLIFLGVNCQPPRRGHYDVPIVVENCTDPTAIDGLQREILMHPRVVGCFRNVVFRDPDDYTLPIAHHTTVGTEVLATEDPGAAARLNLRPSSPAVRKIELAHHACGPWGPPSAALWGAGDAGRKLRARPVDALFVGRVRYTEAGSYPERHRMALKRRWDDLPGNNEWIDYEFSNKPLDQQAYYQKLTRAKIVVSPWGWGAWNVRDFEALICGCVVVKPGGPRHLVHPDILREEHVTFCDPGWRSLPEKVAGILDDIPGHQGRVDASRSFLRLHLDDSTKLATRWAEAVRRAHEEAYR